jgi:tetratricopeptide (TPR) repeat protein
VRDQLKPLAVFHGGANLYVLAQMLDAEPEAVISIARQLIEVGLAEDMGYGHLRLDPALPSYLLREIGEAEQEEMTASWSEAMSGLTTFLYEQRFKNIELAARLTRLELPNLLAMLSWMQEKGAPETVVTLAQSVETLFSKLGLRQALVQATKVREQAAQNLGEWSHALYLTESANVDRLLERGDIRSAYSAATELLERCTAAGEGAYPNADYDIALTYAKLGRVLKQGGAAEAAIPHLDEAKRRFRSLADEGLTTAALMVTVTVTESGDCLASLGRLDEAASAYEEAARGDERLGDKRGIAVNKCQLGTVRMLQGRYNEALTTYEEARRTFESLGEPGSVAIIWHQIGLVNMEAGQHQQAERAFRQSLAVRVQLKDLAGESGTLTELGNLYQRLGQLEEAAKCHRQAADITVRLNDRMAEGRVRNNLAIVLIQLRQYEEARRELICAIECKEPYGFAAELWKTWALLQTLEQVTGNQQAAEQIWRKSVQAYLEYRRAGGQGLSVGAQLCAMLAQQLQGGEKTETEHVLAQLQELKVDSPWAKTFISKLQAILGGSRNPSLADDPNLGYDDAVELQLLLEALNTSPRHQTR